MDNDNILKCTKPYFSSFLCVAAFLITASHYFSTPRSFWLHVYYVKYLIINGYLVDTDLFVKVGYKKNSAQRSGGAWRRCCQ